MENDAPVIYGLEFQARALTAHTAETEAIEFFVGTQSLRCENQIHRIDFDDENNVITKTSFVHSAGELWDISASTVSRNVLATVYNHISNNSKAEMKAAIWSVPCTVDTSPADDNLTNVPALILQTEIDSSQYGDVKSVLWHPSGESSTIISLVDSHILVCDIESASNTAKLVSVAVLEGKSQPKFTTGRWNPHHNCVQIATANDSCIRGWDLRTLQQTYCIDSAHGQLVRDLDFNPNRQYYLASCGDDCKTKFWDVRNVAEPVKVLSDHSHWVWKVRYNHFHDQLVLTSSSDSRVILNNLASISSEPYGHLIDDDVDDDVDDKDKNRQQQQSTVLADGVVSVCEEHEDSVYTVEWSCADPWTYASLSYDGRLVINRVPRATKYRILL
jgi:WD40 repeat protein